MIPAEAVEAAASLLYPGWETSPADWKDYFRRKATEALEVAAPHMLAGAWGEGHEEGVLTGVCGPRTKARNPYVQLRESA